MAARERARISRAGNKALQTAEHAGVSRPGAHIFRVLWNRKGFTLLEMIIVISIFSIMALLIAPRIPHFLSSQRGNFIILTSFIAKTFDDSFIRGRTNFLIVHLFQPDMEMSGYADDIFSRENGVSVVNLQEDGKFTDSTHKLLRYHRFAGSFRIEEVIFPHRDPVRQGNVFIPFYAGGYSDDAIMHIMVNDSERWSVRIFKFRKEARILPEYAGFE